MKCIMESTWTIFESLTIYQPKLKLKHFIIMFLSKAKNIIFCTQIYERSKKEERKMKSKRQKEEMKAEEGERKRKRGRGRNN